MHIDSTFYFPIATWPHILGSWNWQQWQQKPFLFFWKAVSNSLLLTEC